MSNTTGNRNVLIGKETGSLNENIGELSKKGLSQEIQTALDICRLVGNDAVHPGVITDDNEEIVGKMFSLINFIINTQISQPKHLEDFASQIITPQKQKQINNRDK